MINNLDTKKVVLNGSRPSPLKVSKDSHVIQRKQPVIIYTHSPKIIHTKPKDFRALVQKLTGCSRPEGGGKPVVVERSPNGETAGSPASMASGDDRDHKFEISCGSDQVSSLNPNKLGFTDFPLFTPNMFSSSSPRPMFRYLTSPNHVNLSPSFVEYMKGLPEY